MKLDSIPLLDFIEVSPQMLFPLITSNINTIELSSGYNYNCIHIPEFLDDVMKHVNTICRHKSELEQFESFANTKFMAKYNSNTLWKPTNHHLMSQSKRDKVFTFVLATKFFAKTIKQIVPKPLIHILINKFIFY